MNASNDNLSRRNMLKGTLAGTALFMAGRGSSAPAQATRLPLRLGGQLFEAYNDPDTWVRIVKKLGYTAAYCPVKGTPSDDVVKAYEAAAAKANIVIAEVGAWSNPMSNDDNERKAALEKCRRQLDLADRIGARCCVNVSGSRGEQWAGPSSTNLTAETFDRIVEITQKLIDDVQPSRTYFTLEAMPWSYPDSADSYVRLLQAIDRKRFAVHLDPMNLISSPQIFFNNGAMIRDCFAKLGPHIKSCHAKDIRLDPTIYTPHFDEVRAGLGQMDYPTFLTELAKIGDIPLMIEHLPNAEEYQLAADHIRGVAKSIGLAFDA